MIYRLLQVSIIWYWYIIYEWFFLFEVILIDVRIIYVSNSAVMNNKGVEFGLFGNSRCFFENLRFFNVFRFFFGLLRTVIYYKYNNRTYTYFMLLFALREHNWFPIKLTILLIIYQLIIHLSNYNAFAHCTNISYGVNWI